MAAAASGSGSHYPPPLSPAPPSPSPPPPPPPEAATAELAAAALAAALPPPPRFRAWTGTLADPELESAFQRDRNASAALQKHRKLLARFAVVAALISRISWRPSSFSSSAAWLPFLLLTLPYLVLLAALFAAAAPRRFPRVYAHGAAVAAAAFALHSAVFLYYVAGSQGNGNYARGFLIAIALLPLQLDFVPPMLVATVIVLSLEMILLFGHAAPRFLPTEFPLLLLALLSLPLLALLLRDLPVMDRRVFAALRLSALRYQAGVSILAQIVPGRLATRLLIGDAASASRPEVIRDAVVVVFSILGTEDEQQVGPGNGGVHPIINRARVSSLFFAKVDEMREDVRDVTAIDRIDMTVDRCVFLVRPAQAEFDELYGELNEDAAADEIAATPRSADRRVGSAVEHALRFVRNAQSVLRHMYCGRIAFRIAIAQSPLSGGIAGRTSKSYLVWGAAVRAALKLGSSSVGGADGPIVFPAKLVKRLPSGWAAIGGIRQLGDDVVLFQPAEDALTPSRLAALEPSIMAGAGIPSAATRSSNSSLSSRRVPPLDTALLGAVAPPLPPIAVSEKKRRRALASDDRLSSVSSKDRDRTYLVKELHAPSPGTTARSTARSNASQMPLDLESYRRSVARSGVQFKFNWNGMFVQKDMERGFAAAALERVRFRLNIILLVPAMSLIILFGYSANSFAAYEPAERVLSFLFHFNALLITIFQLIILRLMPRRFINKPVFSIIIPVCAQVLLVYTAYTVLVGFESPRGLAVLGMATVVLQTCTIVPMLTAVIVVTCLVLVAFLPAAILMRTRNPRMQSDVDDEVTPLRQVSGIAATVVFLAYYSLLYARSSRAAYAMERRAHEYEEKMDSLIRSLTPGSVHRHMLSVFFGRSVHSLQTAHSVDGSDRGSTADGSMLNFGGLASEASVHDNDDEFASVPGGPSWKVDSYPNSIVIIVTIEEDSLPPPPPNGGGEQFEAISRLFARLDDLAPYMEKVGASRMYTSGLDYVLFAPTRFPSETAPRPMPTLIDGALHFIHAAADIGIAVRIGLGAGMSCSALIGPRDSPVQRIWGDAYKQAKRLVRKTSTNAIAMSRDFAIDVSAYFHFDEIDNGRAIEISGNTVVLMSA